MKLMYPTEMKTWLKRLITSTRGREVLSFCVFLLIATVFWLMLTLNNEMQEDLSVPIEMVNVPDSVTLINEPPSVVKVSVRNRGLSLLRYARGTPRPLRISWTSHTAGHDKLSLTHPDLQAMLRDYFGSSSQIVSISPDSISLYYTSLPGRRASINLNTDVRASAGYIINGPITANIDSVMLYSVGGLPHTLTSVTSQPVVVGNLRDTTRMSVALRPIPGVRMIPDHIELTIPVEPLIARKQMAQIVAKNMPQGSSLTTFPSRIEVSYLIPMSQYGNAPYDITAYVDFADIANTSTKTAKLPITLSLLPESYHNCEISPDSVEFIFERHATTD